MARARPNWHSVSDTQCQNTLRLQPRCGLLNRVSSQVLQEHEHLVVDDPSALFIRCTGTKRQKATPAIELRELMIAVFHFQKHNLTSNFILRSADMVHRARKQRISANGLVSCIEILSKLGYQIRRHGVGIVRSIYRGGDEI